MHPKSQTKREGEREENEKSAADILTSTSGLLKLLLCSTLSLLTISLITFTTELSITTTNK